MDNAGFDEKLNRVQNFNSLMGSTIYCCAKIHSNGHWEQHERGKMLCDWKFIEITMLNGEKEKIRIDGVNPPSQVILHQQSLFLEYD